MVEIKELYKAENEINSRGIKILLTLLEQSTSKKGNVTFFISILKNEMIQKKFLRQINAIAAKIILYGTFKNKSQT